MTKHAMKRADPRTTSLRLVHSTAAGAQRERDAQVLRIEQEILAHVEAAQAELLANAARLVAERLAPLDARAAQVFLRDLREGALP